MKNETGDWDDEIVCTARVAGCAWMKLSAFDDIVSRDTLDSWRTIDGKRARAFRSFNVATIIALIIDDGVSVAKHSNAPHHQDVAAQSVAREQSHTLAILALVDLAFHFAMRGDNPWNISKATEELPKQARVFESWPWAQHLRRFIGPNSVLQGCGWQT